MKQRLKEKREKINKTKTWFLEKINKIASAILIKKKRQSPIRIRNESGDLTTNTTEIQRSKREYYKELYINNGHITRNQQITRNKKLLRMIQEEIKNMNIILFQFHEVNFLKLKQ